MNIPATSALKRRFVAAGWHLLISTLVAALAAGLVFGLWYPGPYRFLSGGQELFLLVVSVDVVLGPLLTFAVFNLDKGWPHLRRDLAVIGVIQLAGLGYGLHTVYLVRPVAMVFEVDRFRVITAMDVNVSELGEAPPEFRSLPLTGPRLLSVRLPKPGAEETQSLGLALKGIDLSQRPPFWRPYDEARAAALARGRPVELLNRKYPEAATRFEATLAEMRVPSAAARFLPLVARGDWVVILDARGDIAGFLKADGFF